MDVGAFVDGPEFDTSANLPTSGTATYRGRASGLHTVQYEGGEFGSAPTDEFRIAEFGADVHLTAFFGSGSAQLMTGLIDNFVYTTPEEGVVDGVLRNRFESRERPFQVLLYDASILGDGSFSSRTVRVINTAGGRGQIVRSFGSWQGNLSSIPVSVNNPTPRLAAGTFETEYHFPLGTVGQYIGSFIADTQ